MCTVPLKQTTGETVAGKVQKGQSIANSARQPHNSIPQLSREFPPKIQVETCTEVHRRNEIFTGIKGEMII